MAKNPALQTKLREEQVAHFGSNGDPTYDQLNNSLPYLDAVVHETLRLHAPLWHTIRIVGPIFNLTLPKVLIWRLQSTGDDIIPLSEPVKAANGEMVDRVAIATGQEVLVPIRMINRSCEFWGPDAKAYKPERWLDENGLPSKAKSLGGHRHLLTFSDGARTCLGKGFALAEFKVRAAGFKSILCLISAQAILSVLIRHYAFELRDGPDTKFELGRGLLPRPKVAGEDGCSLPLRVRRIE